MLFCNQVLSSLQLWGKPMAIHSTTKSQRARRIEIGPLMRDLPFATRLLIIVLAAVTGFMLASWIAYLQVPPSGPGGLAGVGPLLNQGGYCGDGFCDSSESCSKCPTDCGKCQNTCGNGTCDPEETCASCTADCCPNTNKCSDCNNDGVCNSPQECTSNCGDCPSPCGDGICAAHEVDSCCGAGNDCTVAITCGDGICSACENSGNCAVDCQPTEEPTTVVPTTVVPTTAVPVTKAPTKTGSTATSAPSTATVTLTATLTATATATGSATPTVTPTPEPEPECGLVPYESRPEGWQAAYATSANPGDYIPVQAEDLEVWVCPVPETGDRLCIPIYNNILEPVDSDLTRISLVDCSDVGVCRKFDQVGQLDGDQLCFTINAATNPSCTVGCALSPDAGGFALPFPWWYLLVAAALLLLLLLILLLIRRRRDDDDSGDSMEGVVTRERPPSPAPVPAPRTYEQPPTILEPSADEDPSTMRVPPVPPPTDQH